MLEKSAPSGNGSLGGKLVAAVAREARLCFLLGEATLRVAGERAEDLRGSRLIGDRAAAHASRNYAVRATRTIGPL